MTMRHASILQRQNATTAKNSASNNSEVAGRLYRLVRRLSANGFRLPHWTITPSVSIGHEFACWGYPACLWVSFEWVAWNVQFAVYSRPCEHCFFYKPNVADEPCL